MRSIVSKEDDPAKSLQSLESADEAIYVKFLTTSATKSQRQRLDYWECYEVDKTTDCFTQKVRRSKVFRGKYFNCLQLSWLCSFLA